MLFRSGTRVAVRLFRALPRASISAAALLLLIIGSASLVELKHTAAASKKSKANDVFTTT
jgi:hypothetical protein